MPEVTLIAGAGPGLGAALANRFADGGHQVAMFARDPDRLGLLAKERADGRLRSFACDVTEPDAVEATFARVEAELGAPGCVVFNAGAFRRGTVLELEPAELERCWRVGCLGGFLVARAAACRMLDAGRGTILFTGATASLRGGAGFAALAVPKFGLRALAQSLARELGPQGIHVAHVLIDGQIRSPRYEALLDERGPDALLEPTAIAELYWQLHMQPRSVWTLEADVRPFVEKF
jgi:NAD(P)-dependent dehydrogenase (short-subunit alcohol dehydrogenase family)